MRETKCPHCGRRFIPAPQHAHINHKGAYCKPTCWIHRDDGKIDRRKAYGKKCKIGKYTADGILVKVFPTLVAAGKDMGRVAPTVRNVIISGKLYNGYKWQYITGDVNG